MVKSTSASDSPLPARDKLFYRRKPLSAVKSSFLNSAY